MSIKLLTEHHLEFLSLKGGCTGSSESTLVKMQHCWKSHATALFFLYPLPTEAGKYCLLTQTVAQYHPHHVTYAPVNFEVAMSNGLGKYALIRKYII